MTGTQTRPAQNESGPVDQQTVHFCFYRIRPSWWLLDLTERKRLAHELLSFLHHWDERLLLVSYSLTGLRADCDFMLWKAADSIDDLHTMGIELTRLGVAAHLETAYAYLSLTRRSIYVRDHEHEGQEGTRRRIAPAGARYLFVYPFVKTREWYALPVEQRQAMMSEHIRIGHKYPRVRLNTTYSFGLDDQEFVLAFESDYPGDFLDLVMELRESDASRYTLRDTPVFTCIRSPGQALLASLGL